MFFAVFFLVLTGLAASFPTGLALGTLIADVDVRAAGSGNIGATNVNRLLGRKVAAATLLGDLLKGLVPVLLAPLVVPGPAYAGVVGLVAFAGHCWSPYLDFRGGKGVATAGGVLLGLAPWAALLAAAGWVAAVRLTRRSSVGALLAAGLSPILVYLLYPPSTWTAVLLAIGIALRHRENLTRLRAGTER